MLLGPIRRKTDCVPAGTLYRSPSYRSILNVYSWFSNSTAYRPSWIGSRGVTGADCFDSSIMILSATSSCLLLSFHDGVLWSSRWINPALPSYVSMKSMATARSVFDLATSSAVKFLFLAIARSIARFRCGCILSSFVCYVLNKDDSALLTIWQVIVKAALTATTKRMN